MNYNYPQQQFQMAAQGGYGGYRPVPQYPQWTPQMTSSTSQVRPVSSIEEVKACPIDFDGSVFYFADVANRRIYTKQINLDGTVSINLYEQKELASTDQSTNSSYVTKQEFESTVNQLKAMYEQLLNYRNKNEQLQSGEENQQSAAQSQQQFIF